MRKRSPEPSPGSGYRIDTTRHALIVEVSGVWDEHTPTHICGQILELAREQYYDQVYADLSLVQSVGPDCLKCLFDLARTRYKLGLPKPKIVFSDGEASQGAKSLLDTTGLLKYFEEVDKLPG